MAYNLIEEAWIPVLRKDGQSDIVAPWQLTDDNPPIRVAACRADFNGALTEFLIGLVQTCMPPQTEREWRKLRDSPPSPDILYKFFSAESDAFLLDGHGPRFMQDLTLTSEKTGKLTSITSLLIDSPGDNTVKRNTDFFVKRGRIERLCPACAAGALYTMQSFAPSGGSGNRTSLRGGGPLTTIILGNTLWETIWSNMLTYDTLKSFGGKASMPREGGIFPWLAPTHTSEKGEKTHLSEVHPLHVYWGMPRRIRLVFEESAPSECSLCNLKHNLFTSSYLARPRGYDYTGSWVHPLSPIRDTDNGYLAVKGSFDGLGYQNWLGLVYRELKQKNSVQAAPVVYNYRNHRVFTGDTNRSDFRIWAFGYDMDNMKPRGWCEGIMPAWAVPDKQIAQKLTQEISRLILCAVQSRDILQWALQEAFFSDYLKANKQSSYMESVSERFWSATRSSFFSFLVIMLDAVMRSDDPQIDLRLQWLSYLNKTGKDIYTYLTNSESLITIDPKGYARGWSILTTNLSPYNKKMNKILDLALKID